LKVNTSSSSNSYPQLAPPYITINRFLAASGVLLMSSLVKPHKQSFLRKQESRKTKKYWIPA
ncbi:MAG: hypothetical protein AAB012_00655, partial [Nitrospirota bacterium]